MSERVVRIGSERPKNSGKRTEELKLRRVWVALQVLSIIFFSYSLYFLFYFKYHGFVVSYYPWSFGTLITNPIGITYLFLEGLVVSPVSLSVAGIVAAFSRTKRKSNVGIVDKINSPMLWESIPDSETMDLMTLHELNEEMTRSYVRLAILEHNIRGEQINKIALEAKLNLPQPEESSSEHEKIAKRNSRKNNPKDRKQGSAVRDPGLPISKESRHSKILTLRKSGFSFGEIGRELHTPKSTVQSDFERHSAGRCSCLKRN